MAENSNIRDKAKLLWIKGMKMIGNTATNIANNTKFKVDEMTLQNRRRELSGDLSNAVYAMWLKGMEFAPELTKMLTEMQLLDERLNDMRAARYAQGKPVDTENWNDGTETETVEDTDETIEDDHTAEEDPDEEAELIDTMIGTSPSVRSEIDECFDHTASVDKMAEKVNNSLDQLTDKLRSFSPESEEQKGNNTTEEKE